MNNNFVDINTNFENISNSLVQHYEVELRNLYLCSGLRSSLITVLIILENTSKFAHYMNNDSVDFNQNF